MDFWACCISHLQLCTSLEILTYQRETERDKESLVHLELHSSLLLIRFCVMQKSFARCYYLDSSTSIICSCCSIIAVQISKSSTSISFFWGFCFHLFLRSVAATARVASQRWSLRFTVDVLTVCSSNNWKKNGLRQPFGGVLSSFPAFCYRETTTKACSRSGHDGRTDRDGQA